MQMNAQFTPLYSPPLYSVPGSPTFPPPGSPSLASRGEERLAEEKAAEVHRSPLHPVMCWDPQLTRPLHPRRKRCSSTCRARASARGRRPYRRRPSCRPSNSNKERSRPAHAPAQHRPSPPSSPAPGPAARGPTTRSRAPNGPRSARPPHLRRAAGRQGASGIVPTGQSSRISRPGRQRARCPVRRRRPRRGRTRSSERRPVRFDWGTG